MKTRRYVDIENMSSDYEYNLISINFVTIHQNQFGKIVYIYVQEF